MTRVKRGVAAHKRHKKIFKLAKGFRGKRKNIFKLAKVAVIKAGVNAYRDRRLKKRTIRRLWIIRLNAALRAKKWNYSWFINNLKQKDIQINRKILSDLVITEPQVFDKIFEVATAK